MLTFGSDVAIARSRERELGLDRRETELREIGEFTSVSAKQRNDAAFRGVLLKQYYRGPLAKLFAIETDIHCSYLEQILSFRPLCRQTFKLCVLGHLLSTIGMRHQLSGVLVLQAVPMTTSAFVVASRRRSEMRKYQERSRINVAGSFVDPSWSLR